MLHTGETRVLVSFTPDDLERLIADVSLIGMQERLLCALGTIDPERERAIRASLVPLDLDPSTATGKGLDALAELTGTFRKEQA